MAEVLELEGDAEVRVRVDEPGQERAPLEVEADVVGAGRGRAAARDRGDAVTLDDDGGALDRIGAGAVDQRRTAQFEAHGAGVTIDPSAAHAGNSWQSIGAPASIPGSRSSRNVPGCGS